MPLARVQISEDKAKLVKALRAKEDGSGVFQTYADVLTFAAVLGFKHRKKSPLGRFSRKDPDAVLQDQFRNSSLIRLIAIAETQDPKIFAFTEEADRQRVQIFQEYANAGLEILQKELYGVKNLTERILLILYSNQAGDSSDIENLDLSDLFG